MSYRGRSRRAPDARIFTISKAHRHCPLSEAERARNRSKSKVRANVEHVFLVIKRIFGFSLKSGTAGWQRYQLALGHVRIDESVPCSMTHVDVAEEAYIRKAVESSLTANDL